MTAGNQPSSSDTDMLRRSIADNIEYRYKSSKNESCSGRVMVLFHHELPIIVDALRGAAQGAVGCGAGLLETNPALFDILNSALGTMHYHRLMSALNWNGYQIVRPDTLSAVTPSPGARSWTPDQFWEYVGAMAGEFEAGQMRDMLAAKGLSITSTQREGGK